MMNWKAITAIVLVLSLFAWANAEDLNPNNKGQNAVFIGYGQCSTYVPEAQLRTQAARFNELDINVLFPNVGLLEADGSLLFANFYWHFIRYTKQGNPEATVIAWINGNSKIIDISNPDVRNRIVAGITDLVFGTPWIDDNPEWKPFTFDGVLIDIEPIESGNEDFLQLLREIKAAIGGEKLLSVACQKWRDPGSEWWWDSDYYLRISEIAGQLMVMSYDTGEGIGGQGGSATAYLDWMADQVDKVTNLVVSKPEYVYFGVLGSRRDPKDASNPSIENLENGLKGINKGLSLDANKSVFGGVAIYGNWLMTESDWSIYDKCWIHWICESVQPLTWGQVKSLLE